MRARFFSYRLSQLLSVGHPVQSLWFGLADMAGKLSQPGCFTNTGARSGRPLVKLDIILPENNNNNRHGVLRRFSSIPVRRDDKKSGKSKGKKIIGRNSSFLQFSSKAVTPAFENAREGVDAALRKFQSMRATYSPRCGQVLAAIKNNFPHLIVNKRPVEGSVPGVEVGRCFASRAELCLVGLHRLLRAGIDWKDIITKDGNLASIAISIVVSGGYEDDVDEGYTLTYTGEGGQDERKRQHADQKMEGGNMALRGSCILQNSVRVIRGRPEPEFGNPHRMLYSYDGLYKVASWKADVGLSDYKVYKFRLIREEGQGPLRWQSPVSSPRNKVLRGFQSLPRRRS